MPDENSDTFKNDAGTDGRAGITQDEKNLNVWSDAYRLLVQSNSPFNAMSLVNRE